MKALIQKRLKNQKGLTLIELLVVIVILGIIAAIAIPMVMSNVSGAHENTNKQNANLVQDAINRHMATEGVITASNNIPSKTELQTALVPKFISSIPNVLKDDGNASETFWKITGDKTTGLKVEVPDNHPGGK